MQLSSAQLAAAVQQAGLGRSLTDVVVISRRRYGAQLDGRPVVLTFAGDAAELRSERTALQLLAGLAEPTIPALIGELLLGDGALPLLIVSRVGGQPYAELAARLDESARRAIGEQLAGVLAAVHRLRSPLCGDVDDGPQLPSADYLVQRATQAAQDAGWSAAECRRLTAALQLVAWPGPAALIHGGLDPQQVLISVQSGRWRLSGVVGWQSAQWWHPAWDHVTLQHHWSGADDFAFRVGYGRAYDELNVRPGEQVRELALLPYRLIERLEAGRSPAAWLLLSELEQMTQGTAAARTESEIA